MLAHVWLLTLAGRLFRADLFVFTDLRGPGSRLDQGRVDVCSYLGLVGYCSEAPGSSVHRSRGHRCEPAFHKFEAKA